MAPWSLNLKSRTYPATFRKGSRGEVRGPGARGQGSGARGQEAQGTPGVRTSEGLARERQEAPVGWGTSEGPTGVPMGRQDPSPGRSADSAPSWGPGILAPGCNRSATCHKHPLSETEAGMAALSLEAVLGTIFALFPKMGKLHDCPSPPRVEVGSGLDLVGGCSAHLSAGPAHSRTGAGTGRGLSPCSVLQGDKASPRSLGRRC